MENNKSDRELKETLSVFKDPKTARQAWRSVGQAILAKPAVIPTQRFNNQGEETTDSLLEGYTYHQLAKDLKNLGDPNHTQPTEIEMILACQILKARTDTSAAIFVRDTLGAKPVDESKQDLSISNPYESLTDEELEILAKHREKKMLQDSPASGPDEPPALTAPCNTAVNVNNVEGDTNNAT